MIVTLSGTPIVTGRCVFRVRFSNESNDSSALPINAIQRSGAREGLHFFFHGAAVDPIRRVTVTAKFVAPQAIIPVNQEATIEFVANVDEKAAGVYELAFKDITYQVTAGCRYQVQFAWHDWSSNTIDWSIG